MWEAYPYYHGKLKLTKDLKTANAHLRASLIEQEEINNMNNVPTKSCRSSISGKITIESMHRLTLLPLLRKNLKKNRQQLI